MTANGKGRNFGICYLSFVICHHRETVRYVICLIRTPCGRELFEKAQRDRARYHGFSKALAGPEVLIGADTLQQHLLAWQVTQPVGS